MPEIETWRDVLDFLTTLAPDQLDQPAQVLPPQFDRDVPVELGPIIFAGTVAELGMVTRGSADNAHHPGAVVLMTDGNPYAADGSIGFDAETGERIWPGGRRIRTGRCKQEGGAHVEAADVT